MDQLEILLVYLFTKQAALLLIALLELILLPPDYASLKQVDKSWFKTTFSILIFDFYRILFINLTFSGVQITK